MLLFSFAAMTKTESVSTSSRYVYGKTRLIYCNQTAYLFHCHDELCICITLSCAMPQFKLIISLMFSRGK